MSKMYCVLIVFRYFLNYLIEQNISQGLWHSNMYDVCRLNSRSNSRSEMKYQYCPLEVSMPLILGLMMAISFQLIWRLMTISSQIGWWATLKFFTQLISEWLAWEPASCEILSDSQDHDGVSLKTRLIKNELPGLQQISPNVSFNITLLFKIFKWSDWCIT